jgi:hypothetical protein
MLSGAKIETLFYFYITVTMSSKKKIQAQIAALQEKLKEPEFTPKALVEWMPELKGKMLHCKHDKLGNIKMNDLCRFLTINQPISVFDIYNKPCVVNNKYIEITDPEKGNYITKAFGDRYLEQYSYLTDDGMFINTEVLNANVCLHGCNQQTGNCGHGIIPSAPSSWKNTVSNDFLDMIKCPMYKRVEDWSSSHYGNGVLPKKLVPVEVIRITMKDDNRGNITLCDPKSNPLDHIYVASACKIPHTNEEVIVDHYPLSSLYKEWRNYITTKRKAEELEINPLSNPEQLKAYDEEIAKLQSQIAELYKKRVILEKEMELM